MIATESAEVERSALRKATFRLIPLIAVGYCVAYMDRVNISFAALQMNRDLHFSETVYGLGAGLFFLSYSLCEIPSNLLLYRFGARRWLSRIMLTWGVLAMGMLFVRTPVQFYAMRLLLGVAEAGFFPGIIFYLMQWFPPAWRARTITRFYISLPLSSVVMGSLAGALLNLQGRLGLAGWQWLFLVEGFPAIVLGVVFYLYLPDSPAKATWLSEGERAAILAGIPKGEPEPERSSVMVALRNPAVVVFALFNFLNLICLYAYTFSAPAIVQAATHWSAAKVGYLIAGTGVLGAVAMLVGGMVSDRKMVRHNHIIPAALLMSAGFVMCGWSNGAGLVIGGIALIVIGYNGMQGPLWSLPATFSQGRSQAAAIGLIGTVGICGGFVGPYAMGYMKDLTGSYQHGLMWLAVPMGVGAGLMVWLRGRAGVEEARAEEERGGR